MIKKSRNWEVNYFPNHLLDPHFAKFITILKKRAAWNYAAAGLVVLNLKSVVVVAQKCGFIDFEEVLLE